MGRKVTAEEKRALEAGVREKEERAYPTFDITIVVADEVGPDGKVPVSVTRTAKINNDLGWDLPKPPKDA